jgi:putative zinc finger/helix-turn-helix YgiT family protein
MPYTLEVTHDGRSYQVEVPELRAAKCTACGEAIFSNEADEQITAALRSLLRLLTPEQIRAGRKRFALSQNELAQRLGVAEETISRWETGALIQPRAMDNLLRLYFALPEARAALCGAEQAPDLGLSER